MAAFTQGLATNRAIAAKDANDARAQRGLEESLFLLGRAQMQSGEVSAAKASLEESVGIARKLAKLDSDNAEAQRDLTVILKKVGDLKLRTGDLRGARAAFDECLAVDRALVAKDAGDADAKRDVSIDLNNIGRSMLRSGDAAGAMANFNESLDVRPRPGGAKSRRARAHSATYWLTSTTLGEPSCARATPLARPLPSRKPAGLLASWRPKTPTISISSRIYGLV